MPAIDEKNDGVLADLWRRVCAALEAELGERPYKTWIVPMQAISADLDRIVLVCPSAFDMERVSTRFGERIANLFALFSKTARNVDFVVAGTARLVSNRDVSAAPRPPTLVEGSVPLDPRLSFANFVTGPSNLTAFNVAQGVASGTELRTNPLFIFGPTGTGKTHLLQAAASRMLERDPGKRVLYLTSEAFVRGFLSSLRGRETQSFKDFVRNVDVLCCDDVQFLEGKTASVEEFFHTFDDLIAHGKQIILTADRSPSLIEQLPERLRSRLINGGGIEIGPADFNLRLAILRAKAGRITREHPTFVVGDDVLHMMAAKIQANARVLDGALKRIYMQSDSGAKPITFVSAQAWLADFLHAHDRRVTLSEIGKRVAQHYGLTPKDLLSACRKRDLVKARQVGMFVSRVLTDKSYPEIGKHYARDHTTVIHGYEKVRDRRACDPDFKAEVDAIQRSIRDWSKDPSDNNTN